MTSAMSVAWRMKFSIAATLTRVLLRKRKKKLLLLKTKRLNEY